MSGGSYEYAYERIESLADAIEPSTPLRKVFKEHLRLVAKACHDIEWVDSGDWSDNAEEEAIIKCLSGDVFALCLKEVIRDFEKLNNDFAKYIGRLKE